MKYLVSLLVILLLAGCARVSVAPTVKPLRVAVVMPSAINDMAFSQSMYSALKDIQTEQGIELKYSENMFKVPDAAAAFRDYASQGYDIIIGHGSQYIASLQEIAKDYP